MEVPLESPLHQAGPLPNNQTNHSQPPPRSVDRLFSDLPSHSPRQASRPEGEKEGSSHGLPLTLRDTEDLIAFILSHVSFEKLEEEVLNKGLEHMAEEAMASLLHAGSIFGYGFRHYGSAAKDAEKLWQDMSQLRTANSKCNERCHVLETQL